MSKWCNIVSISCWQIECCWVSDSRQQVTMPYLYSVTPPDWLGHSTYYNSCYTMEGHGHLYHKIYTKIETIWNTNIRPKWDRTEPPHFTLSWGKSSWVYPLQFRFHHSTFVKKYSIFLNEFYNKIVLQFLKKSAIN